MTAQIELSSSSEFCIDNDLRCRGTTDCRLVIVLVIFFLFFVLILNFIFLILFLILVFLKHHHLLRS
ncbi:hypothetical protein UCDDS831_g03133 [Diplodia seriata]|uniref:Uncharacterized protein n=1 Tax=Diplodia seriata TaxID=420778 RepID=A0A0G2EKW3_9PEZI|nr:hypothetical protein UCDDS831_g03133 [Diplodia seriata]